MQLAERNRRRGCTGARPLPASLKGEVLAESLAVEMGRFLNDYAWDIFATLTFRTPRFRDALPYVRPWLRHITRGRPHRAFVAEEFHKDKERLHLHALVQCAYPIDTYWAWNWWWKRHGFAKIKPYNPQLKASYYVAKYVAKEIFDTGRWVLWGKWSARSENSNIAKIRAVFPAARQI